MQFILIVALASPILPPAGLASAPKNLETRYPLFKDISLPENALPPGCVIPKDVKPPLKGMKNRHITADSRAFFLVDEDVTKQFRHGIEATYYAVYEEGNEIGILAWAFRMPESAREVYLKLTTKYAKRFRFWQIDKYVICLWRDKGTSDKCFHRFEVFIEEKVKGFRQAPE